MSALEDLTELVAALPSSSLLSENMKQAALTQAVVPDSAGVWPGQPGYVATYDVYYAALGLISFLRAQPVIRSSSSEGTSVSVDAPDWAGLVAWYKSMSRIASGSANVLGTIEIPATKIVTRTDMSGRWNGDDNVDTDLD